MFQQHKQLKKIVNTLKNMFSLKEEELNLFFTDIDKIKKMMLDEMKKEVKS